MYVCKYVDDSWANVLSWRMRVKDNRNLKKNKETEMSEINEVETEAAFAF